MTCWIPLRARDGSVRAYTLVDADDYERLASFRWHLFGGGYAARAAGNQGRVYMHREILGVSGLDPLWHPVDHINHDPLDNRRSNLRLATKSENALNQRGAQKHSQSGIRGVFWHKGAGRWTAQVRCQGRKYWLGLFDTAEEADAAVRAKRRELGVPDSPALNPTIDGRLFDMPAAVEAPAWS